MRITEARNVECGIVVTQESKAASKQQRKCPDEQKLET